MILRNIMKAASEKASYICLSWLQVTTDSKLTYWRLPAATI